MTRRTWAGLLGCLLLAGCNEGSGSDIGPELAEPLDGDYRVLVRDDQGIPVSEARVTISGVAFEGLTGRTGRATVHGGFEGVRVFTVDGTNGSATDTDELGVITFAADTPADEELPFTVYLPDLSGSSGLTLTTGLQASNSTLNDTATSGAVLTVQAGDTVTLGTLNTVTLKSGSLTAEHVPITTPGLTVGVQFTGRGVLISPNGVMFSSGAALTLPNDLGLGTNQTADLYHIDASTGAWTRVGSGTETAGLIVAPAGSVRSGGLYTFVASSPTSTVVTGAVVDTNGEPVYGVHVRGPQSFITTNEAGSFTLPPMVATDASNNNRLVNLEFDGGRDYLPVRLTEPLTLSAPSQILPTKIMNTSRTRLVRVLMIRRGERFPLQRLNLSGEGGLSLGVGTGNQIGQISHEDIPVGWIGFDTAIPIDDKSIRRSLGAIELKSKRFAQDLDVFSDQVDWLPGRSGDSLVRVVDERGNGPIEFADVVVGSQPNTGLEDETNEVGVTSADIGKGGQVTSVKLTVAEGRTVISALTLVNVNTGMVSMPIERARQNVNSFQRHGLFGGNLTSSAGSNTRQVFSTGTMTIQNFIDEAMLGRGPTFRIPKKVDPAVTGGTSYLFGVPFGIGHLAAIEGTTTAGRLTVERMALDLNLASQQATRSARDLNLALLANTGFLASNAVLNRDARIPLSAFRFDLVGELPDGVAVQMAQDVAGNLIFNGNDATFTLPGVPSGIVAYLAAFKGSGTSAGTTVSQQSLLRLGGLTPSQRELLPVPTISSPAPGGTISSTGFAVQLNTHPSALYTKLQLRSETATEIRNWEVWLPWDATAFNFVQLPSGVPPVIVPGRVWTLTATSARVDVGPLLSASLTKEESYWFVLPQIVSIQEYHRGVRALASSSITVTSN